MEVALFVVVMVLLAGGLLLLKDRLFGIKCAMCGLRLEEGTEECPNCGEETGYGYD